MLNMGSGQFSFLLFLCFCQIAFSSSIPHPCRKDQSSALLKFKKTLIVDPSLFTLSFNNHTSSCNMSRDCCSWDGVVCDEITGHVIELDLRFGSLVGKIDSNSSLFQLSHLQRLDLSFNNFSNSRISPEFGRFSSLTHLDLSESYFSGQIPSEISHLSKLQSFHLSDLSLGPHNFKSLLQNLTQLRGLDLTNTNISSTIPLNFSSHLTTLILRGTGLYGVIPESIFHLPNLETLDLSRNYPLSGYFPKTKWNSSASLKEIDLSYLNFSDNLLPQSLGYLTSVHSLSLGNCKLRGPIPESLSNLTRIKHLYLQDNSLNGTIPSGMFSLPSLSRVHLNNNHFSGQLEEFKSSSLVWIDLNNNQLQGHLPNSIQNLVNLTHLDLSFNNFSGNVDVSLFSDLKQLSYLSLSKNSISLINEKEVKSTLPESLVYLLLSACEVKELEFIKSAKKLSELDLSDNTLNGTIPSWIFSLPSLSRLHLSNNHFSGQLEDFNSDSLIWIDLRNNQLQGHLPKSIQNHVNLRTLDLSSNNFSGHVDASFFVDLKQLGYLDLSYNRISLTNVNKHNVTLPGSLMTLQLAACEVKELEFLRSAKNLWELDLSNNKIQGRIPDWAWSNWMFSLQRLNLSHNMLTSVYSIPLQSLYSIDLRSNLLQGSLPIPPISTESFSISQNNLSEEIPSSICNLTSLVMLDLARNNLKGAIPQCLGNISGLIVLDMHNNKLSGTFPTIFSNGNSLTSLNLRGNKLEGKIPRSLANCKKLQVLDLGHNHLNDTFPMWLGTLPDLHVLSLRFNKLHGSIQPSRIESMFPNLRVIDLSYNAFSGNLPTSLFQHLKAMRTIDPSMKALSDDVDGYYQDSVVMVTKRLELEVDRILFLYTAMDLSNNNFEGHIPSVIGDLIALRVLNISHNGLQGHIPSSLGNLSKVESLDLSFNLLSGDIPRQLASLTSLEVLQLSHNHLEGCIPKGPQFNTFGNDSYDCNDRLRGFPVSGSCGSSRMPGQTT